MKMKFWKGYFLIKHTSIITLNSKLKPFQYAIRPQDYMVCPKYTHGRYTYVAAIISVFMYFYC